MVSEDKWKEMEKQMKYFKVCQLFVLCTCDNHVTTYYISTPFTHSVTLSGYESTLVCTGQTRSLCSGPGRGIVTECCKHPHLHSHPVLPALYMYCRCRVSDL